MLRLLIAASFALLLIHSPASRAAATSCPSPFSGAGDAFFYNASAGSGACGLQWVDADYIVAMNSPQWAGSVHCGECLRVTGPAGTVVAKVVDECPDCPSGTLDLSVNTFLAVGADLALGRVPIEWERVECPVSGPLSFRFAPGSSPFWLSLQVREHRYGVAAMSMLHQGSYQPMLRNNNNYFVLATGTDTIPVQVRITSTTGEVLEQTFDNIEGDSTGTAQFAACEPIFSDGFEG
jgi:expansin